MTESLRSMLPPVYRPLVDDFFDRPKVVETRATCRECAMCDHGQPSPVAMEYFSPNTKCCTYTPNLPNYLVGAILADPAPEMAEGKRRLREVLATRRLVTPLFLMRPRKLTLIISQYGDAFGRAESLLCPYYDATNPAGSCTIWKHREGVCMTYHCKYTGGQRGFGFWTSLRDYLFTVEPTLARHAMQAVDRRVTQPVFKEKVLSVEDVDDLPPKASDYARWWQSWVGREEEFYVACFEWVSRAGRADFAKDVDSTRQGRKALAKVIETYDKLETKVLPRHLVRSRRMTENHTGDKIVVTTYHRYDSFVLDKDLYEVIGLLQPDETLEENLERLKSEHEIELLPELVEYLFAQGILVDPNADKPAKASAGEAGELNGRRAALGAILRARGIFVDAASRAKIDEADLATLDAWIRRAATAAKIGDVLNAPGTGASASRRKR